MDLTTLYAEHKSFIEGCAGKIARKYGCAKLLEDLVSVGTVTFLEQTAHYDEQRGASLSTFLYPHIMGAMRREAERSMTPFGLSRREFEQIRRGGTLTLTQGASLDEPVDEDGNDLYDSVPAAQTSVEQTVYIQICLEHLQAEFAALTFKEREILGSFFGVYGHEEQTLAEIGEAFQMKENAALKAKDKALAKLRRFCMEGELGRWRSIQAAIREAQHDCVIGRGDLGSYCTADCCEDVE